MTAASKSQERRVYVTGQIVGNIELVEVYPEHHTAKSREPIALCRCRSCGYKRKLTYYGVYSHDIGRATTCSKCRKNSSVRLTKHDCVVCSDCPALRPADGTPCACGESRQ